MFSFGGRVCSDDQSFCPEGMEVRQPTLFDRQAETRFQQYHAANPEVYRMFRKFAHEAIRGGAKRLGGKLIAERLRWESYVQGNDGWKINNSYISFYVRLFQRDFPAYAHLFETRSARADREVV